MEYSDRLEIYKRIEQERDTAVLTYVTSDRPGWDINVASDVIDPFVDLLDAIGPVRRISLILHTLGGRTLAAWRLVNLIRMFCDELEVIVPSKALSAGTLMCIGADKIVMTKQAVLGPIDPSVNSLLNPQIDFGGQLKQVPVSVESIRGYLNLARQELGIDDSQSLAQLLVDLSSHIHPVVLGDVFRSTEQIRFLARKLLPRQVRDEAKVKSIVDFLCADSGSHDYTIDRREASEIGLNIVKPSDGFYTELKSIHASYSGELNLLSPFTPTEIFADDSSDVSSYQMPRGIIEGATGGCYSFISEGIMTRIVSHPDGSPVPQQGIEDERSFDGWRKIA